MPMSFDTGRVGKDVCRSSCRRRRLRGVMSGLGLLCITFAETDRGLCIFNGHTSATCHSKVVRGSLRAITRGLGRGTRGRTCRVLASTMGMRLRNVNASDGAGSVLFGCNRPIMPGRGMGVRVGVGEGIFAVPTRVVRVSVGMSPGLPRFERDGGDHSLVGKSRRRRRRGFCVGVNAMLRYLFSAVHAESSVRKTLGRLRLSKILCSRGVSQSEIRGVVHGHLRSSGMDS